MKVHELKTHPKPFEAMWNGLKTYEVRKDDRGFKVGDVVNLREWNPESKVYTGCRIEGGITYKTDGGTWGLPDGLCVLQIGGRERFSQAGVHDTDTRTKEDQAMSAIEDAEKFLELLRAGWVGSLDECVTHLRTLLAELQSREFNQPTTDASTDEPLLEVIENRVAWMRAVWPDRFQRTCARLSCEQLAEATGVDPQSIMYAIMGLANAERDQRLAARVKAQGWTMAARGDNGKRDIVKEDGGVIFSGVCHQCSEFMDRVERAR